MIFDILVKNFGEDKTQRIARQKSESGIYFIFRGANRQEIFPADDDCLRFIETFKKYKIRSEMKVYGPCLIGNHIHLLVEEGKEKLSVTMKRLAISYVGFYNWKYKVFQKLKEIK